MEGKDGKMSWRTAAIENQAPVPCPMCHMRIRPQVLNELKGKERLVIGENCGLVLN